MNEQACFWGQWSQATMHFCEAKLCDIIVQPANAYSNLGFVLMGLYLFKIVDRRSLYVLFPISSVLVGITSFLYHASWTFFFQVFDVTSMFTLSALMLSLNLLRLGKIGKKSLFYFYPTVVILSGLLMFFLKGKSGEYIFGTHIIFVLISESILYLKKNQADYSNLKVALLLFGISFFIWNMDAKEIWCRPDNHIWQGHALWHVINAFCFYYLYRFYQQFSTLLTNEKALSGKN
ncbi:MAG: ceramidase domain-containing protein [Bacteriovoracaceae bacterium]|nr:ceramidase domain-containing protein [Bacteriovoracaceae bacterium]